MNNSIRKALAIVERGTTPYQPLRLPAPAQQQPALVQRSAPIPTYIFEPPKPARQPPTVNAIDLARVCSLHDRPYFARYIDGHYTKSIKFTPSLSDQYEGNEEFVHYSGNLGYEKCPWCGAYDDESTGGIFCTGCERIMCYGTLKRRYFRCPCGHHGTLHKIDYRDSGLIPSYRRQ